MRRSYASAVLGVVILSVRPSVTRHLQIRLLPTASAAGSCLVSNV